MRLAGLLIPDSSLMGLAQGVRVFDRFDADAGRVDVIASIGSQGPAYPYTIPRNR